MTFKLLYKNVCAIRSLFPYLCLSSFLTKKGRRLPSFLLKGPLSSRECGWGQRGVLLVSRGGLKGNIRNIPNWKKMKREELLCLYLQLRLLGMIFSEERQAWGTWVPFLHLEPTTSLSLCLFHLLEERVCNGIISKVTRKIHLFLIPSSSYMLNSSFHHIVINYK